MLLQRVDALMNQGWVKEAFRNEGRSQVHSLLDAAMEADLVLELEANLLYRAGKNPGKTWGARENREGRGPREAREGRERREGREARGDNPTVADLVIRDIEAIKDEAHQLVTLSNPSASNHETEQFALKAIAMYFGYLYWRVTANGGMRGGRRD